jgi:ADP-dependent NAD(P)H-hydrate dehydratase
MSGAVQNVSTLPALPVRPAYGHKGTFGRVLVVAGSRGMSGAAVLCGSAAVRGGAGLVTVACPADVQDVVAVGNPCYTTAELTTGAHPDDYADLAMKMADHSDVVAIGPGLGRSPVVRNMVRLLLLSSHGKPTVLDADGLNVLPPIPDAIRTRTAPLVLTPHPGEFARLTNTTTEQVQANRLNLAIGFAANWNVVLLLKGRHTIVTDGARVYVNGTGNPGMATGGTGDVLTGLIAALMGQGLSGFDAAVLGAWTHGRAGDLAADAVGQTALCAVDVLTHLPAALREVERNSWR